jgi:hypothetical protein
MMAYSTDVAPCSDNINFFKKYFILASPLIKVRVIKDSPVPVIRMYRSRGPVHPGVLVKSRCPL